MNPKLQMSCINIVFLLSLLSPFVANSASPDGQMTNSTYEFWHEIEMEFVAWLDYVKTRVEQPVLVHFSTPVNTSNGRILVDLNGKGDFTSLQKAIDSVPEENTEPVFIQINAGTYKEKVIIPKNKPYITLQGQGRQNTVIVWSDTAAGADSTFRSASVGVNSIRFTAFNITFQNAAPAQNPGAVKEQAVAFRISGDQAAFYGCGFLGHQDTLYDHKGKHYFKDCYIEGSIDFIFGNGQSLYKNCELHVVPITPGALTAQKRSQPDQDTGFSFVNCAISGSGIVYLGRAWGPYSRVVYAYTYMADIIIPQGWYDWGDPSRPETVYYGQYMCTGPGAAENARVQWSHELTVNQARPFLTLGFVDGTSWVPE